MWVRRLGERIMRYLRIIRSKNTEIITIGEYVAYKQPEVYKNLKKYREYVKQKRSSEFAKERVRDITEQILKAADVKNKDKQYIAIMTERPKPGRGGLLPKEKGDVLW